MRTRIKISVPSGQEIPEILFYKGKYYRVIGKEVIPVGIVVEQIGATGNYAIIAEADNYTIHVQEVEID